MTKSKTIREADVRGYLHARVEAFGGYIKPIKYIGTLGCPDDLVGIMGRLLLIEGKRPGKDLRPSQQRERNRWEAVGVPVYRVNSFAEVDELLKPFEQRMLGTNPWFVKPDPKPGSKVDLSV